MRFHVEIAACGHERQKREKTRVSDVCGHTTILDQLTSTTEMCPTGGCTYRRTATALDTCAWTNSNVP